MNLLGLIFSLLITLSIAFCALFEKQIGGARLRSSYIGHAKANRKIFQSYNQEFFSSLPYIPRSRETISQTPTFQEENNPPFPKINPPCARLNLWPLIHEGKEAHPLLYQMVANLLRTFYGPTLFNNNSSEFAFLDAFLSSLQMHPDLPLEKLPFLNPIHRKLYYQMLKGTKKCDLFHSFGYPPLLEYISLQPTSSKPCLFHAHPYLLSIFFDAEVAQKLYRSIHKKDGPPLTSHFIEQLCSETHLFFHPEIFSLVELKSCRDLAPATTFTGTDSDTQISLKKEIFLDQKTL